MYLCIFCGKWILETHVTTSSRIDITNGLNSRNSLIISLRFYILFAGEMGEEAYVFDEGFIFSQGTNTEHAKSEFCAMHGSVKKLISIIQLPNARQW